MKSSEHPYLKWAAYGIVLLVLYLLQTSKGIWHPLFGYYPDMLPFFIGTIALLEGETCGAALGILAGLLCDITRGGPDGLCAVLFGTFGYLLGAFSDRYFGKNILSAFLMGAVMSVGINLLRYLFYYAILYHVSIARGAIVIGMELLVSMIFFPAVYLIVRGIYQHFLPDDGE